MNTSMVVDATDVVTVAAVAVAVCHPTSHVQRLRWRTLGGTREKPVPTRLTAAEAFGQGIACIAQRNAGVVAFDFDGALANRAQAARGAARMGRRIVVSESGRSTDGVEHLTGDCVAGSTNVHALALTAFVAAEVGSRDVTRQATQYTRMRNGERWKEGQTPVTDKNYLIELDGTLTQVTPAEVMAEFTKADSMTATEAKALVEAAGLSLDAGTTVKRAAKGQVPEHTPSLPAELTSSRTPDVTTATMLASLLPHKQALANTDGAGCSKSDGTRNVGEWRIFLDLVVRGYTAGDVAAFLQELPIGARYREAADQSVHIDKMVARLSTVASQRTLASAAQYVTGARRDMSALLNACWAAVPADPTALRAFAALAHLAERYGRAIVHMAEDQAVALVGGGGGATFEALKALPFVQVLRAGEMGLATLWQMTLPADDVPSHPSRPSWNAVVAYGSSDLVQGRIVEAGALLAYIAVAGGADTRKKVMQAWGLSPIRTKRYLTSLRDHTLITPYIPGDWIRTATAWADVEAAKGVVGVGAERANAATVRTADRRKHLERRRAEFEARAAARDAAYEAGRDAEGLVVVGVHVDEFGDLVADDPVAPLRGLVAARLGSAEAVLGVQVRGDVGAVVDAITARAVQAARADVEVAADIAQQALTVAMTWAVCTDAIVPAIRVEVITCQTLGFLAAGMDLNDLLIAAERAGTTGVSFQSTVVAADAATAPSVAILNLIPLTDLEMAA